jgi:hypothetical protein
MAHPPSTFFLRLTDAETKKPVGVKWLQLSSFEPATDGGSIIWMLNRERPIYVAEPTERLFDLIAAFDPPPGEDPTKPD